MASSELITNIRGPQGYSVERASILEDGELRLTLSDGRDTG